MHKPNGNELVIHPKVQVLDPGRELTWGGGVPGIFTGRHVFRLEPLPDGRTRLVHEESFRGIAVPFAELGTIEEGYEQVNRSVAARVEALRVRTQDYVKAARALGRSEGAVITHHVLPNATVSALAFAPFLMTGAIASLASLDFLGLGLPADAPSLGEVLRQGKNHIEAPWLGLSGFITLVALLSLLVFIGEGLRDAFDPRKAGG